MNTWLAELPRDKKRLEEILMSLWEERKAVEKKVESLSNKIKSIEDSFERKPVDGDKGYRYYSEELRAIPQRREKTIEKIDTEVNRLQQMIEATRLKMEREIERIQQLIDAQKLKRERELEQYSHRAGDLQSKLTEIIEKADCPNSAPYRRLKADRDIVEASLKEVKEKITAATDFLTSKVIPTWKKTLDRKEKEREEMEKKAAALALEEGKKAWEARMAAENAASLEREKIRISQKVEELEDENEFIGGDHPPPRGSPPPPQKTFGAEPSSFPETETVEGIFNSKEEPPVPINPFEGKSMEEMIKLEPFVKPEDVDAFFIVWNRLAAEANGYEGPLEGEED